MRGSQIVLIEFMGKAKSDTQKYKFDIYIYI